MKTCSKCKNLKSVEFFFRSKRAKDGRESACKECQLERLKIWYANNKETAREVRRKYYHDNKTPESIRRRNLKRRYGLELEEYEDMLSSGCEICGSLENLCIDHDHGCCPGNETCGKCIRGVLCWTHNLAEAAFQNIEQIEKLLEYRNKWAT